MVTFSHTPFRRTDQLIIAQAPFTSRNTEVEPLPFFHLKRTEPEGRFIGIPLEVLRADAVIGARQRAPEMAPTIFNRVCVDRSANVLILLMLDDLVLVEFRETSVTDPFVGVDR